MRAIDESVMAARQRVASHESASSRVEYISANASSANWGFGADLRGFHAVRVNDQYRIVFRFEGGDAFDVLCTDYH